MRLIEDLLPENCYKPEPRTYAIDTVVIHFISALNWDQRTPEDQERMAAAGVVLPEVTPAVRKYHPAYCRALLVAAKLSYHYLIDRHGVVSRLVPEDRVAWHAGVSKMPTDGREWVNSFSIGVSLIASHPKDDPEVKAGREPGYTEDQYQALGELIADVRTRHPLRWLVGHDEVAPGRKYDPGELFDWSQFRGVGFAPL